MMEAHNTTCEAVLFSSNSNNTRIWPGLQIQPIYWKYRTQEQAVTGQLGKYKHWMENSVLKNIIFVCDVGRVVIFLSAFKDTYWNIYR